MFWLFALVGVIKLANDYLESEVIPKRRLLRHELDEQPLHDHKAQRAIVISVTDGELRMLVSGNASDEEIMNVIRIGRKTKEVYEALSNKE